MRMTWTRCGVHSGTSCECVHALLKLILLLSALTLRSVQSMELPSNSL